MCIRRLRIAQVAPVVERVPPMRYGGTERVIHTLTEELVRRGHEVTLFASGDSRTSARLVPIVARALWRGEHPYSDFGVFATITWGCVCREMDAFDVVHSHLGPLGLLVARAQRGFPPPVVTTAHGRLDLPELGRLYQAFAEAPLVSISDAQRRPIPNANWVATVHHGIPVADYPFSSRPGGYLAFLGRVSPDKGLDTAIRVARRVGMPLRIAARPPLPFRDDPESRRDRAYWDEVVQPLLREPAVDFLGEVDDNQRSELLSNAAALLFPVRWPEPFGLVVVEALACGAPVLALRAGSVPELIDDGITGFIRDTDDELVEAVGHIGDIDRARCRAEAERRFSVAAMVDAYEQVYRHLLQAHAGAPRDGFATRGPPAPGDGQHRPRPPGLLSAREEQIARLAARGSTNAEIARELIVSPGTVANHIEHMLVKLGLPSRAALAAWAVERDLMQVHERYLATLERLIEIQPTGLAAVMDRAARVLADELAIETIDLYVHDPKQRSLVLVETSDTPARRRQRTLGLSRLPLEQGGRIVDVFRTGTPYVTGHADRDALVRPGFTRGLGLRSVAAAPVDVDGARWGVLLLQANRAEAFSEQDLRFLRTVACWLGSVVRHAEVEEARTSEPTSGVRIA